VLRGFDGMAAQSTVNRIADALRQAVVEGDLRPGSRINESELAAAYQMSRGPIREALRMLQQEGLVVLRPRRGAFVKVLTPKEARDIYVAKSLIYGHAVRVATEQSRPADLDTLSGYLARMEREAARSKLARYLEASEAFQSTIMTATGNDVLVGIYRGLDRYVHLVRSVTLSQPGRLDVSLAYHRALLEAIRRRDAEAAERLVREHLQRTGVELAATLERMGAESRLALGSARAGNGGRRPARRRTGEA
jgi:DNA-binding GntR family transcriptional regulator